MGEFTISDLKKKEKRQARGALLSTTAAEGDDRRYHTLSAGLKEYGVELFGAENGVLDLVKTKISLKRDSKLKIFVLGAGSGKMARDLITELGQDADKIDITELSLGDPRTQEEKDFDNNHNIKFLEGDINETKFEKSSFDLVLSRMFMLHMIDPLRVTKKIYRSLTHGGEFYSDFQFVRDFAPRFPADNRESAEKANLVISNATRNGSFIYRHARNVFKKKQKEIIF